MDQETMKQEIARDFEPYVRFLAEYQMMGDLTGHEFMTQALNAEMAKEEDSRLSAFKVLESLPGTWGIQLIVFTVDVPIRHFEQEGIKSRDDAKDLVQGWLNEIVGDSDVEVRWVASAVGVKA